MKLGCFGWSSIVLIIFVVAFAIDGNNSNDGQHSQNAPSTQGATDWNAADWPFNNPDFRNYAGCLNTKIESEPVKWQLATSHMAAFTAYFNHECESTLNAWLSMDSVCRKDYEKCIGQSAIGPIIVVGLIAEERRQGTAPTPTAPQ
ncbi:MAG: hypothetical protein JO212_15760 [Acetobacteraceae bacterium]|nr:hypothetical protein [Acetobacteraceae bacterium]